MRRAFKRKRCAKPKFKGSARSRNVKARNRSALNWNDDFLMLVARKQADRWRRMVRRGEV